MKIDKLDIMLGIFMVGFLAGAFVGNKDVFYVFTIAFMFTLGLWLLGQ